MSGSDHDDVVEYSEGVCADGASILRNGEPVSIPWIIEALKDWERGKEKDAEIERLRGNTRSHEYEIVDLKYAIWCALIELEKGDAREIEIGEANPLEILRGLIKDGVRPRLETMMAEARALSKESNTK